MGIFTRFRDIVSSNINSMLDRAEDPEKLIRLMIREMEDTLVELKAACAGVMAETKTVQRRMDEAGDRSRFWADKAKLAIDKGRDELAREALVEKRRHHERFAALEAELKQQSGLVAQYHEDIRQLEDKLKTGARQAATARAAPHPRRPQAARAGRDPSDRDFGCALPVRGARAPHRPHGGGRRAGELRAPQRPGGRAEPARERRGHRARAPGAQIRAAPGRGPIDGGRF